MNNNLVIMALTAYGFDFEAERVLLQKNGVSKASIEVVNTGKTNHSCMLCRSSPSDCLLLIDTKDDQYQARSCYSCLAGVVSGDLAISNAASILWTSNNESRFESLEDCRE